MSKLILADLANLQNENTAVSTLNANSASIETALENTLSRDGTSPNQMGSTLDMNSNRIINLPVPTSNSEPVIQSQIAAYLTALQAIIETPVSGNATIASITQFGAVGDDSTDNTTAITAALNSGVEGLYIPSGVFLTSRQVIPSTIKYIFGPGTLKTTGTHPSGAEAFLHIEGHSTPLLIQGLTIDVPTAYAGNGCIAVVTSTSISFKDITFIGGGRFNFQLISSTKVLIENCDMGGFKESGIDSLDCAYVVVSKNRITGNPDYQTINTHNINIVGGEDNHVVGNYIREGYGFGCHFHGSNKSRIVGNTFENTPGECCTVANSLDCLVENNIAHWTHDRSIDFGMSHTGDDAGHPNYNLVIRGNILNGSCKSGIWIGPYSYFTVVENNIIIDCNQGRERTPSIEDNDNCAGVTIASSSAISTIVRDNYIVNTGSNGYTMRNGIQESNSNSTGNPVGSMIVGNRFSGITDNNVILLSNGSTTDEWLISTPTVAATSGAFTTVAGVCRYKVVNDKTVHFQLVLTNTTNNTAAGLVTVTLPYAVAQIGMASGTNTSNNKQVVGQALSGGSLLYISLYDGTYPWTSGQFISVVGSYEKA